MDNMFKFNLVKFNKLKSIAEKYDSRYNWITNSLDKYAGLFVLTGKYNWKVDKINKLLNTADIVVAYSRDAKTYSFWVSKAIKK